MTHGAGRMPYSQCCAKQRTQREEGLKTGQATTCGTLLRSLICAYRLRVKQRSWPNSGIGLRGFQLSEICSRSSKQLESCNDLTVISAGCSRPNMFHNEELERADVFEKRTTAKGVRTRLGKHMEADQESESY
eukprot:3786482-Pleurochrysis_carterae.AAC.2